MQGVDFRASTARAYGVIENRGKGVSQLVRLRN